MTPPLDAKYKKYMMICGNLSEKMSLRISGRTFIPPDSSSLVSALEEDLPASVSSISKHLENSKIFKSLLLVLQE